MDASSIGTDSEFALGVITSYVKNFLFTVFFQGLWDHIFDTDHLRTNCHHPADVAVDVSACTTTPSSCSGSGSHFWKTFVAVVDQGQL